MKYLKHLAVAFFFVSFLLPAYRPDQDAFSGWDCFRFCLGVLDGADVKDVLWRYYYFGFVPVNVLFLISWLVATITSRFRVYCALSVSVGLVYVASWLVLNFMERETIGRILVDYGYWLWFGSFLILFISQAWRFSSKVDSTIVSAG